MKTFVRGNDAVRKRYESTKQWLKRVGVERRKQQTRQLIKYKYKLDLENSLKLVQLHVVNKKARKQPTRCPSMNNTDNDSMRGPDSIGAVLQFLFSYHYINISF